MTIDPNVPAHRRAAVIGASMAGLLAARVLSDNFDEVVLFERDKLPDSAAARKGAAQGLHLHVLLTRGQNILAELFPGLVDELVQGGAEIHDTGLYLRWHQWGAWKATGECGITGLYASRLQAARGDRPDRGRALDRDARGRLERSPAEWGGGLP